MSAKNRGFSLVEIMVIISLIAVLSAIAITSFRGITSRARDSIRKRNLQQLSSALEIYYQKNNRYIGGNGTCDDSVVFYDPQNGIAPYMSNQTVPVDPGTKLNYCYEAVNNGTSFRLFAKLENCSDPDIINPQTCPNDQYNYTLVSPDLTPQPYQN